MVLLSQTDKHAWDHFYKKKLCRLLRVSMQIPNLKHQMAGLIKQMTGECADVQEETVSGWYRRL